MLASVAETRSLSDFVTDTGNETRTRSHTAAIAAADSSTFTCVILSFNISYHAALIMPYLYKYPNYEGVLYIK